MYYNDLNEMPITKRAYLYAANIVKILQENGCMQCKDVIDTIDPNDDNIIRWGREYLKQCGYIDITLKRGIWGLSDTGKTLNSENIEDLLKTINKKHLEYQRNYRKNKILEILDDEDEIEEDNIISGGYLYVFDTKTFTSDGKKIIKIGTTKDIESRLLQLYCTATPYQFEEIFSFFSESYKDLEVICHKFLDKYRLNSKREFFTEDVLPHIEKIIKMYENI